CGEEPMVNEEWLARKSLEKGKSVDHGGRRIIKKKTEEDRREGEGKVPCSPVHTDQLEEEFNKVATQVHSTF
ncbi:MAG: hypothetical protein GY830_03615, partial [Bacteroidetes bacterium]|nr:hypothetical protein [Bacteroidota bacterium]